MSMMENGKLSEEQLKEITGGLYGGGAGQWAPAMVKRSGGLPTYTAAGQSFVENGRFAVAKGEYIVVDTGRKSGNFIIAFSEDREAWISLTDVVLI